MYATAQKENQAANNATPAAAPATRIQPKLSIGAVNDPLEHEADTMADKVMSMQEVPSAVAAGAGGIQRKCAGCEEEEKVQRKPLASFIQRKESSVGTVASDAVSNKINASKGGGNNMDSHTQSFMQSRFGTDFSDVKIHTGGEAIQMNRELNAKAFTVGNDIYFNEGQYNPGSGEGKHLLAHELTHTVQQKETVQREKIQRLGPAAAAGIGFAAGLVIGAVTFAAALDYARSLSTRYPGWLSVLPNCPCNESSVLAASSTWDRDKNPALSWFHPGAASSYRSKASFSSVPGSSHGQQCTYKSSGELITDGPGAGTPDVWSPNTNGASHFLYDASTWQVLGWRIYNRYWTPNNGNGCPSNNGDNTFMRRVSEFLP